MSKNVILTAPLNRGGISAEPGPDPVTLPDGLADRLVARGRAVLPGGDAVPVGAADKAAADKAAADKAAADKAAADKAK